MHEPGERMDGLKVLTRVVQDVDLICGSSNIVYSADAKDAPASSIALGRVVGPDVYVSNRCPPFAVQTS